MSPKRLPLDDVDGMQVAPPDTDVEVDGVVGWDWAADPHALGTWYISRPGPLGRPLPELRRTEGWLFFANVDPVVAWRSFIDGAIESGYRAARDIDAYMEEPAMDRAHRRDHDSADY